MEAAPWASSAFQRCRCMGSAATTVGARTPAWHRWTSISTPPRRWSAQSCRRCSPSAAAALCGLGGIAVPGPVLAVAAVGGAIAGFVAPDLGLRRRADERRREFTVALRRLPRPGGDQPRRRAWAPRLRSSKPPGSGDSWVFHTLRRTIDVAQIDGTTIWTGCAASATSLSVPAVVELAASVALAGSEGAKVRNTIAVKADGLRAAELADAESRAQAATERMAIPTAMLLFGFVLLIGFPAVITVLGGL